MATPPPSPSSSLLLLLALLAASAILSPTAAARFACISPPPRATCQSLVGFAPANATTLAAVRSLFQLRSFRALLAANGMPLATPATFLVVAGETLRVRLPCACSGGSGVSYGRPFYRAAAGDTLDSIARVTFAGLVTSQELAVANNVTDPNKITAGGGLFVPLPCSCDDVGGDKVVHYAHVVAPGETLDAAAAQFGTTAATLMSVNGIKDVQAGQVLDVPLKACSSSISATAADRNLRVSNDSYMLTANNCIQCSCSSSSWQLDCVPTQGISSSACPAALCGDLPLGNSSAAASGSACETTTCSYAGYTNATAFTILTNLTTNALCSSSEVSPVPQPSPHSSASLQGLRRPDRVLAYLALLCLCYLLRS